MIKRNTYLYSVQYVLIKVYISAGGPSILRSMLTVNRLNSDFLYFCSTPRKPKEDMKIQYIYCTYAKTPEECSKKTKTQTQTVFLRDMVLIFNIFLLLIYGLGVTSGLC